MRWKWVAAIAALMVLVLIASVYAYLNTYDYNELKPRVARIVKDATGRDLNLSGEIDLSIGFSPALVVRDITFANAPWASQPKMLKIDELQAQVRLLPLLLRNVELRHIGLKGVDVLLETNPDGEGNWEFAVDESPAQKAAAPKPTGINIDNVRIENLNLTIRDGKTGSAKRIDLIDLKAKRQAATAELAVDLKANYTGQPLTLSGKTGLVSEAMTPKRFPLELSGAFSDAAIKLEGTVYDLFELKDVDVKVRTSGENLAKLKLADNIRLPETSAFDITGHLRGSKKSFALSDVSGNLSVSDINLSLSGSAGSSSQVSSSFLVQNFNLGDFLKETGKSDQVRANVDIAAYGKSRGDSVSSLMANLDGSIGAVMGEGYLTKYLDLLSVNLTQEVISFWGRHEKADQIQCAVVQFDIKKGIADSRAFVFDTQAGVLTGEGKINLGTEQINFLLVPKPEHPSLSLSTKLRVSGTVMEPKVRPDTISILTEGAKLLSALAVGPIGLLAPFVHLGANNKHPCDIGSTEHLGVGITPNRE